MKSFRVLFLGFMLLLGAAGVFPAMGQSGAVRPGTTPSGVNQFGATRMATAQQVRAQVNAMATTRILSGRVFDASGQPMPFVSVYLKSNPQVGGSTGPDGGYKLELPGGASAKNEVVVFSFIGYKTVEKRVQEFSEGERADVQLAEQPILLEGTAVTARVSKKTEKAAKESFLKKFRAQLAKDFPDIHREYKVVSSARVNKEGAGTIAFNEFKGKFREFPGKGRGGRDSLWVVKESIQGYSHDQLKVGLKKIGEKWRADSIANAAKTAQAVAAATAKGKNLKKGAPAKYAKTQELHNRSFGSTVANLGDSEKAIEKRSVQLHTGLWSWNSNVRQMAKKLDYDPKRWNISYTNDYTVLTYRQKKGFLGIFKMETQIHFILDSYTYSVRKIAESAAVEVNIPIGYKLTGEMLDALNLVNIGEAEIEKYRLRHANIDAKRNVIYQDSEQGKVPDEKNMDARVSIEDTKNRLLKYQATATAKVTATEIFSSH